MLSVVHSLIDDLDQDGKDLEFGGSSKLTGAGGWRDARLPPGGGGNWPERHDGVVNSEDH
jgi:hypothetical protein